MLNLVGIAHAHYVAWLVFRQQRQHFADHFERKFARLAHAQSADCVAVEIHLDQPLCTFAAKIVIHPALHDAEKFLRVPVEAIPRVPQVSRLRPGIV